MILGGVAAVLLIAGGVFFFLNRGDGTNKSTSAANAGAAPAPTAILNFKVTTSSAYGDLAFSFDTDPGTTRVATMLACLGDDLKSLDNEIDPDYSSESKARSAGSVQFCTVSKVSGRPNSWTGHVYFPLPPRQTSGSLNNQPPQKVSFVFRSDRQMISAPLIVEINFSKQTSQAVALPANAPQARMSKMGQMANSRGRGSGAPRERDIDIDDSSSDVIYFEGPGSRGILAGDFSPIAARVPTSGGGGGISNPLEGRWTVISAGGKPESGTCTFSGNTMTATGSFGTRITTYRLDAANSRIFLKDPDRNREETLQYEINGNMLRLFENVGGKVKDEVIFTRE